MLSNEVTLPLPTAAPPAQRIELRCACGECHLPFAYLENGMLVIESFHSVNGQKERHRNVIPLLSALTLVSPVES